MKPRDQINIQFYLAAIQAGEILLDGDGRLWQKNRKRPLGSLHNGYVRLNVQNRKVFAHRVVVAYHNGGIPPGRTIRHRNGQRDDNRIGNLAFRKEGVR